MLVSFIVVALNTGDKLKNLIHDLIKQDYDHKNIEIIFVDSNSNDNTRQVMNGLAESKHDFARVCILDNPKKILPCGWNIAIKESLGDVMIRIDAHASIPTNFISKNIEWMKKGEKIIGGHRISIIDNRNSWQKTLLIAETSLFGSGIAKYRRTKEKKYVSTLAHAAYSREVFNKVGGYDERLARTEDNEMHYRMREAGYKFLLDPEILSYHHARNTLLKMLKQKYLNGFWIGLTMGVSPKCFSVYHFVPLAFLTGIVLTTISTMIWLPIFSVFLWGVYSILTIFMAVASIRKQEMDITLFILPILFFLLHISYGVGTLVGLIKMPNWRKQQIQKG